MEPLERDALRELGLAESETEAYLSLLQQDLTASELSAETGWGTARSRSVLRRLNEQGLVRRLPGHAVRYRLTSPGPVLSALIQERASELERLRGVVRMMAETHRRETRQVDPESYVEVVGGSEALTAQFAGFQSAAEEEILGCTKLPILLTPIPTGNVGQDEALRRGITNRWLYERAFLELPGALEGMRDYAARGEESRIIPSLPAKFFIFDRQIALIHVTEQTAKGHEIFGLVMRHSELVETLRRLFELLWASAAPLGEASDGGTSDSRHERLDELVQYLAAGMTDAAAARKLGITDRTVRRWVRQLLVSLDAESRFEAGFKLGREASSGAP